MVQRPHNPTEALHLAKQHLNISKQLSAHGCCEGLQASAQGEGDGRACRTTYSGGGVGIPPPK